MRETTALKSTAERSIIHAWVNSLIGRLNYTRCMRRFGFFDAKEKLMLKKLAWKF